MEEWTKAEIGVGADIAAGNHEENGNWALLVNLININNNIEIFIKKKKKLILKKKSLNINKKKISPNRLVKKVKNLLFNVFQFLKNFTKIKEEIPNPSHPKKIKNKLFLEIKIIILKMKIVNHNL